MADPTTSPGSLPATAGWFDAHVVSGAHPEYPDAHTDPASLETYLRRYALSGILLRSMTAWLHDPLSGNEETSRAATALAHVGARACWTAVPPTPGELDSLTKLVAEAGAAEVAAFALYPRTHGYRVCDPAMTPLFPALAAEGMPLWLDRTQVAWQDIDTLAARHRNLSVVVSGIGYRELRRVGSVLTRHRNVHVDMVNFSAHQGVEWLVRHFGPDRLLFATGLGVRDPGESIARLLWSGLDDETVREIGAGNAGRLLPGAGGRS